MSTTIPTPPAPVAPPKRGEGETLFWKRCDPFVQYISDLGAYLVSFVTAMTAVIAETLGYRDAAAAYAAAAQVEAPPAWDAAATYAYPQATVGSDGNTYRCLGQGVTGVDPVGDDGTTWLRLTGGAWGAASVAAYVSAASCTVAGDKRGVFPAGIRVLANCGGDGTRYATVEGYSYDAAGDRTTLLLDLDAGDLTGNLVSLRPCNAQEAALLRATDERLGAVRLSADTGTALAADADIDLDGHVVAGAKLTSWREGVQALGTLTASTVIDCSLGNVVTATIGGNVTFTFANVPASGNGYGIELWLTFGGTVYTVAVTGSKWPEATFTAIPTMRANTVNCVTIKTFDVGTNWYGAAVTGYPA